jgi:hypothetical protein
LHFVAINFHRRALAERISENKLALKVLDQLSNAPAPKATFYGRKGHRRHESAVEADNVRVYNQRTTDSVPPLNEKEEFEVSNHRSKMPHRSRAIASVIVDQARNPYSRSIGSWSKETRLSGRRSNRTSDTKELKVL